MIYFITDGTYTKVGYTKRGNLENRIRSLQTGNARKLSLIKTIEGSVEKEGALHRALKKFHVNGEWFDYNDFSDLSIKKLLESVSYKPVQKDLKPFCAIHKNILPILQKCKYKTNRVFFDVLEMYDVNTGEVYLNASNLAKKHGLSNTRDILSGIKELIEKDVICKKAEKDMYFVNVRYIFSGSRVKYSDRKK